MRNVTQKNVEYIYILGTDEIGLRGTSEIQP